MNACVSSVVIELIEIDTAFHRPLKIVYAAFTLRMEARRSVNDVSGFVNCKRVLMRRQILKGRFSGRLGRQLEVCPHSTPNEIFNECNWTSGMKT